MSPVSTFHASHPKSCACSQSSGWVGACRQTSRPFDRRALLVDAGDDLKDWRHASRRRALQFDIWKDQVSHDVASSS